MLFMFEQASLPSHYPSQICDTANINNNDENSYKYQESSKYISCTEIVICIQKLHNEVNTQYDH